MSLVLLGFFVFWFSFNTRRKNEKNERIKKGYERVPNMLFITAYSRFLPLQQQQLK